MVWLFAHTNIALAATDTALELASGEDERKRISRVDVVDEGTYRDVLVLPQLRRQVRPQPRHRVADRPLGLPLASVHDPLEQLEREVLVLRPKHLLRSAGKHDVSQRDWQARMPQPRGQGARSPCERTSSNVPAGNRPLAE